MVRAPEYEEMDAARVYEMPSAFRQVFGDDGEFRLKEIAPPRRLKIAAGPIERSTYEIYRKRKLAATVHQNGHIECHDESIKAKLDELSKVLELAARRAYDRVVGRC